MGESVGGGRVRVSAALGASETTLRGRRDVSLAIRQRSDLSARWDPYRVFAKEKKTRRERVPAFLVERGRAGTFVVILLSAPSQS